jgi:hypothetical protein
MLRSMQRLFSTFPAGLPGAGVLLLRVLVALGPWPSAIQASQGPGTAAWLVMMGMLSGVLLLGCLTPIAVVVQMLLFGGALLGGVLAVGHGVAVLYTLGAMALLMLGPGAYSVDARRFGRRVVHIKERP